MLILTLSRPQIKFCMITLLFLLAIDYSFLPIIADTIIVQDWHYLGPFSIGMREGVVGVDDNIELDPDYTPDPDRKYPSLLVPGGHVAWRTLNSDNDHITIDFPEVLWDSLQDYYGISGVYCASYVYGNFENPGMSRALIKACGISSFKLNGQIYHADVYEDGFLSVPVVLKPGQNRLLIKTAGFVQHDFSFMIMPAPAPLMIIKQDITAPDIIAPGTGNLLIGVPLINTTDQALLNIKVTASVNDKACGETVIKYLESLSAIKTPIDMILDDEKLQSGDSVQLNVTAAFGDFFNDVSMWLKIKNENNAVNRTFVSRIDGSVQYYSVLPPLYFDPEKAYALIMTCHGAGVKAENQINAYLQKDWAFVVAPTNRRRYGFDWQDWGRLDFLEVLEDVKKHYQINENRVYLTGHSMGGHGVWHIATTHPDLFAAIAPSAGWTNFQLYIPWFLQKSEIFTHPEMIKYRDLALRQDNPLVFLKNLKNVPVYILHGGADDNVPAVHGRMFANYLDVLGFEYVYNEVPGKGHWWDFDSTAGTDCIDLKELMDFLKSKVRDPELTADIRRSELQDRSIKRAYFSPFILVYGTTGDSSSTKNNRSQARYQSYTWWYRANGYVQVIADTMVTDEIIKDFNLVLFGNTSTNSMIKKINSRLPLKIENQTVFYNKQKTEGDDLCIVQVYPNPRNKERLVCLYEPTTISSEKIMGFFTPLYAGAGLPEYIVYDKTVMKYGWAGIKAAGFFD